MGKVAPDPNTARVLLAEVEDVRNALRDRGLDPARCRRELRSALGTGAMPLPEGVTVHRSRVLKERFDDAVRVCTRSGHGVLHPVALLDALLATPTPVIDRVIAPPATSTVTGSGLTAVFELPPRPLGDPSDRRQVVVTAVVRWLAQPHRRNLIFVGGDRTAAVAVLSASADRLPAERRPRVAEMRLAVTPTVTPLATLLASVGWVDAMVLLPDLPHPPVDGWEHETPTALEPNDPRRAVVLAKSVWEWWTDRPSRLRNADVIHLDPPAPDEPPADL